MAKFRVKDLMIQVAPSAADLARIDKEAIANVNLACRLYITCFHYVSCWPWHTHHCWRWWSICAFRTFYTPQLCKDGTKVLCPAGTELPLVDCGPTEEPDPLKVVGLPDPEYFANARAELKAALAKLEKDEAEFNATVTPKAADLEGLAAKLESALKDVRSQMKK